MWEAKEKWYDIGVELGLMVNDLDVIRCKNYDDPEKCIAEMLSVWLRQGGATWEALIFALNHKTVGVLIWLIQLLLLTCHFLSNTLIGNEKPNIRAQLYKTIVI